MNDLLLNTLYKVGKVWDRYNVFEGAKKKTKAPHTVEELVAKTFIPAPAVFYIFNFLTQKFNYVSESYSELLGYHKFPKDLTMKEWLDLYPPNDRESCDQREALSMSFAQRHFKTEDIYNYKLTYSLKFRHKDGHYVPFLHQGFPLATNSFGQITEILIIHTDMSGFDYYDEQDVSFIAINKGIPSYYSINNWENHKLTSTDDYNLTARQIAILKLISEGKTNQEIADHLNISIETVKTHRRDLLQKTGKGTMYELLSEVIDKGLISYRN